MKRRGFRIEEGRFVHYPGGASAGFNSSRGGFTLIELLIVLVIILILAGLLLGAVFVVQQRVKEARQTAEIQQLDVALNKFRQLYGIFPPSRIRLREFGTGTNPNEFYHMDDPFDQHSVQYLKRIWPNIKLAVKPNPAAPPTELPVANQIIKWFQDDTVPNPAPHVYELEGDECLVFFLGGVAQKIAPDEYVLHGFTSDPQNPSRAPNVGAPITQTNRTPPLYDFDAGRLIQREVGKEALTQTLFNSIGQPGGPEADLLDTQAVAGRPYVAPNPVIKLPSFRAINSPADRNVPVAYFSAYEGRGYRPNDLNVPDALQTLSDVIPFQVKWPVITGLTTTPPPSLGPNPYAKNTANSDLPASSPRRATGVLIDAYNPNSFQIIVPGADGEFGAGGNPLDYPTPPPEWAPNDDNITNFSGGSTMKAFLAQ